MNMTRNLQMKLTFIVLTLLVALMVSGAVSAGLEPQGGDYLSAYVVENGYSFTGPTSIDDAVNNYETMDGYHVQIDSGVHEEQIRVNKNLNINGLGANPQDNVIKSSSESATVSIGGVSVVLENLAIWNYGTGEAIVNNGLLTIINCFVNGNYIEYQVTGSLPDPEPEEPPEEDINEPLLDESPEEPTLEEIPEESTQESALESVLFTEEVTEEVSTEEVSGETETVNEESVGAGETDESTNDSTDVDLTNATNGSGAEQGESPVSNDPGIPLASLASGMLMLMGGTVVSGKKHH
ncbi:MAG: hypothetical protein HVN35_09645 [Methanobacteriaceae archaeon]|nr:hypothetical protein [Methanobacteriaceae archaeon]